MFNEQIINVEKSKEINEYFLIIISTLVIGFFLSISYMYISDTYLNYGYPYNTFLFKPNGAFRDFFFPYVISSNPYSQYSQINIDIKEFISNILFPPTFIDHELWTRNASGPLYFPFSYLLSKIFTIFNPVIGLIIFWLVSIFSFGFICIKNTFQISKSKIYGVLIFLLSYPFYFLLDRSNIEIFVFIFIYIFVFYYDKYPLISLVSITFAISMKFFPIFFLLLYLSEKKYKFFFLSLIFSFAITIFGYLIYPGGLITNMNAHLLNLRVSSLQYQIRGQDIAYNHSLLSGVNYLLLLFNQTIHSSESFSWLIQFANIVKLIFGLLISLWIVAYKQERWKKILLITCLMLLIPNSSGDYRLMHFYIPFFFILNNFATSNLKKYLFTCSLLFVPKNFLHLNLIPEANIGVFINPLLMIILCTFCIVEDINSKRLHEYLEKLKTVNGKFTLSRYLIFFSIILSIFLILFFSNRYLHEVNTKRNSESIPKLVLAAEAEEIKGEWSISSSYYQQLVILQPFVLDTQLKYAEIVFLNHEFSTAYSLYSKIKSDFELSDEEEKNVDDRLLLIYPIIVKKYIQNNQFFLADRFIKQFETSFTEFPVDYLLRTELHLKWNNIDNTRGTASLRDFLYNEPYKLNELVKNLGSSTSQNIYEYLQKGTNEEKMIGYLIIGWINFQNGNFQNAFLSFENANKISESKNSYFGLLEIYKSNGDVQKYCKVLDTLTRIDPDFKDEFNEQMTCN